MLTKAARMQLPAIHNIFRFQVFSTIPEAVDSDAGNIRVLPGSAKIHGSTRRQAI